MATTLILGRDGMGDADESDFDAWTSYVAEHIDERTGLDVTVDQASPRDGQTDAVRAASEDDEQTVREALAALWESWCAEGAPGVEASEPAATYEHRAGWTAATWTGSAEQVEAIAQFARDYDWQGEIEDAEHAADVVLAAMPGLHPAAESALRAALVASAPGVEASEGAAEPALIEITDGPETMDGYRADLAADWQTYLDAAISALHPDAEVRIIWSADATRIHARAFVSGDERGASAASVALREAVQSQCEDAWDQWCLTVGGAS